MVGFILLIAVAFAAVPSFIGFPVYVALICLVASLVSALPYYEMMASADREGAKKAVLGFVMFFLNCAFVTLAVLAVFSWLVMDGKIREGRELRMQISNLLFAIGGTQSWEKPNAIIGGVLAVGAVGVLICQIVGRKLCVKNMRPKRSSFTSGKTLLMTLYSTSRADGDRASLYQREDGSTFHVSGKSTLEWTEKMSFTTAEIPGRSGIARVDVSCMSLKDSLTWVKVSDEVKQAYANDPLFRKYAKDGIIECSYGKRVMDKFMYESHFLDRETARTIAEAGMMTSWRSARECADIVKLLCKIRDRGLNPGKVSGSEVRKVLGLIAAVIAMFIVWYVYAELM